MNHLVARDSHLDLLKGQKGEVIWNSWPVYCQMAGKNTMEN